MKRTKLVFLLLVAGMLFVSCEMRKVRGKVVAKWADEHYQEPIAKNTMGTWVDDYYIKLDTENGIMEVELGRNDFDKVTVGQVCTARLTEEDYVREIRCKEK